MDIFFTEKEIRSAIEEAIEELYKNDRDLIEMKCSERAQVHYLAIYFDKAIQSILSGRGIPQKELFPYKVDVEYNRVGNGCLPKKLYYMCGPCSYTECTKRKSDGSVTIDMIFHERAKNKTRNNNIFCLEVKPFQCTESTCDFERIKSLVLGDESMHTRQKERFPHYQYGLALHLLNGKDGKKAEGYFFCYGAPSPNEINFIVP